MKQWLVGLVLAGTAVAAQADAPRLRLLGSVGYGFGGESLVSGNWVDGTTWNLKAGSGSTLAVGGDLRIADRLTVQLSVGHHRESVEGANGNIVFSRVPVELLGFYSVTEQFRVGLGARKAQGPKIRGGGVTTVNEPYESSAGVVLESQYFFSAPSKTAREPVFGMYLRYVKESYTAKNASWDTEKRDGSHVALGLVFYY